MARGNRSNRRHNVSSDSKALKSVSNDGLRDALTGIGGEKDILATAVMGFSNYITRNQNILNGMYRSNIWVKKAVNIPAQYSVKGWRKIEGDNAEIIENYEKRLSLKKHTSDLLRWSSLFGGALALFIVDDGLSPDQPLNLNAIKENGFKRIVIVDRHQAVPSTIVDYNPLSESYGLPEYYTITTGGSQVRYHRSRTFKMVLDELPYIEAQRENFWGVSTIEVIYRQLANDDIFLTSMANMMKKATVDIMGIPGLAQMIKNGQEDQVRERVRIAHSSMSTLNAWVKDAGQNGVGGETYERITQAFSGFDSMDKQSLSRVASAADIPATIFLGKSPDGQNSTGYSDLAVFSDRLTTVREINIDPFLSIVDKLILSSKGKDDITDYKWQNPFPKSELDEADIRTKNVAVISQLALLDIPDSVLAKQMNAWGLIDSEDMQAVEAGFSIGGFEIEGEENEL